MLTTRRKSWAALAAGTLIVITGTACSAGSSDDSASGGGGSSAGSVEAAAPQRAESDASGATAQDAGDDVAPASSVEVSAQQVISTGTVQLKSGDVGQAVFDVRKVVDLHGGSISEDTTETDEDGAPVRSRMVLRIPTAEFSKAMEGLEGVATLVTSNRQTDDVTTEVLDTDVRVEAQRRSIERIQALYGEAGSIKDVVALEGQLSQRQADLASLEAQQRYLKDATQLSTITVAVEETRADTPPSEETDRTGFLAGLESGWNGLRGSLVVLATVAGALLPWLVVLLVLAVPTVPFLRRLRRRREESAALTT